MPKFFNEIKEDPMISLCRMVCETRYENLPEKVIEFSKHSILDTIGVMIGGSGMEGIPPVVDLVKEKGGKQETLIPFYGGRVPASEAGMAMGPMSRAIDYAQIHPEALHCTEHIVPAILAATGLKKPMSGRDFITAFALGQEVLVRIGIAFKGIKGWPLGKTTSHYIFGSVASAGKIMDLRFEELINAQGIAREMTQPHDTAMFHPPTLMVKVHQGFICQDAINACLLAQRGITGPTHDVLLAPRGYLGFASWETDPSALTKGLGVEWEMQNVEFKPYPGCKSAHTAMYGTLDLMKKNNIEVRDITAIDIYQDPSDYALVSTPKEEKWNPEKIYECQFSLPFLVATAVFDKDVFLPSYTPEARARKDVRNLMSKISAHQDPSLPMWGSRVSITLKNSQEYSGQYFYVKGHPKNPFTQEELINKFKKCTPYCIFKLDDEVVDSVIDAILNLEKVKDVENAVLVPLTPGPE